MLAISISLLLMHLSAVTSQCTWKYQWSVMNSIGVDELYSPPQTLTCRLYFQDTMQLHNADSVDHMMHRLNGSSGFQECDNSNLYITSEDNPINVGANSVKSFTIERAVLDQSAGQELYLISEKFDGTCLKMIYFLSPTQAMGTETCNITKDDSSCIGISPTPTPTTPPPVDSSTLPGVQIGLIVASAVLGFCVIIATFVLFGVVFYIMCYVPHRQSDPDEECHHNRFVVMMRGWFSKCGPKATTTTTDTKELEKMPSFAQRRERFTN